MLKLTGAFILVLWFLVAVSTNAAVTKKKILIVGSSFPAVVAGALLSKRFNVTMLFPTQEVDNQFSAVSTDVNDTRCRMEKRHPDMFSNSKMTTSMLDYFIQRRSSEASVNIRLESGQILSISENENIAKLLWTWRKCIHLEDIPSVYKLKKLIEQYNYNIYRAKYSRLTLQKVAENLELRTEVISCFLDSLLLNSGHTTATVNTADAMAAANFYYTFGKNPLKSTHLIRQLCYSSGKSPGPVLVDLLVDMMRKNNATLKPNRAVKAFYVNTSGEILGDFAEKNVKYDYVLLGSSLEQSLSIIHTTAQYNNGAPLIFDPLTQLAASMNLYRANRNLVSLKLFLNHSLTSSRPNVIQISESPYPWSIQSVTQLNKVSGPFNPISVLELIIDIQNDTHIPTEKLKKEMLGMFPELKTSHLMAHRLDWLDSGVLLDENFGQNRLNCDSAKLAGLHNLVLAADWVEAVNSTAWGIERGAFIGIHAAIHVLKVL